MKNIHLRFDEKFFYMMKQDKQRREKLAKDNMTWEDYIKLLFGFTQ